MDQSFRLPLLQVVEPREASLDKDELSSNIFFEKNQGGAVYAIKRPGLNTFIGALGKPTGYYANQGNPDYYVAWEGTFGSTTYGDNFFGLGPPPPYQWVGWYLNFQYVAIGLDPALGFREYTMATSPDGVEWTYAGRLPRSNTDLPYALTYFGGLYYLYTPNGGSGTAIWRSPSLAAGTWTLVTGTSVVMNGLLAPQDFPPAFSSKYLFQLGAQKQVSTDAEVWTTVFDTMARTAFGFSATEYRSFNGESPAGTVSYNVSTDASSGSFTVVSGAGTFPATYGTAPEWTNTSRAVLLNGTWIFYTRNNVYTSTNFLNWTITPVAGLDGVDQVPIWDGTVYLIKAVGPASYFTSTDLVTWTRGYIPGVPENADFRGRFVSNGSGSIVFFALNAGTGLWNGKYTTDHGETWLDNKLPTYFNPLPSQASI
jgi:hypothetical protein